MNVGKNLYRQILPSVRKRRQSLFPDPRFILCCYSITPEKNGTGSFPLFSSAQWAFVSCWIIALKFKHYRFNGGLLWHPHTFFLLPLETKLRNAQETWKQEPVLLNHAKATLMFGSKKNVSNSDYFCFSTHKDTQSSTDHILFQLREHY